MVYPAGFAFHSQDGWVGEAVYERFAPVERDGITILLPWLMGCAPVGHRQSVETDEAKIQEGVISTCRHPRKYATVWPHAVLPFRGTVSARQRGKPRERVKAKAPWPRPNHCLRGSNGSGGSTCLVTRRKGVVLSDARTKSSGLRSPSKSYTLGTRCLVQGATARALSAYLHPIIRTIILASGARSLALWYWNLLEAK